MGRVLITHGEGFVKRPRDDHERRFALVDPATSVKMRWVETDDYYDRVPWPTRTSDPLVTISYDDTTYDVPANAADMLLGFSGVGLVTSTGSAAAAR